jgi:hypothetical protein
MLQLVIPTKGGKNEKITDKSDFDERGTLRGFHLRGVREQWW